MELNTVQLFSYICIFKKKNNNSTFDEFTKWSRESKSQT